MQALLSTKTVYTTATVLVEHIKQDEATVAAHFWLLMADFIK